MNFTDKKHIRCRLVVFALLATIIFSGCKKNNDEYISDTGYLLGTIVSVQAFGTDDYTVLDNAFKVIEVIDAEMSLNIEDSDINAINNSAGKGPITISENMLTVIERSIEYSEISDGAFDITLEPVISLWGIGTEAAKRPGDDELKSALAKVGYEQIDLDVENQTISLPEGVSIDLGGIGKGYVADLVAEGLRNDGVKKAIINLGGNIMVIGEKAEDTPFRVGIQNPLAERNDYFAIVDVADKTVVTSGIYERNFTEDDILYHHIINPETGYPEQNGILSVTVVAEQSIDADGLSTVLFLKGIEEGLRLANELEGVECLFVDENQQVYMSENMGESLEIIDEEFTIVN